MSNQATCCRRVVARDTIVYMRQRDVAEAENLLNRVLNEVATGSLTADGPAGTAVAHRLEGALLALQATVGQQVPSQPRSNGAGR
jgi:hypothetical protein